MSVTPENPLFPNPVLPKTSVSLNLNIEAFFHLFCWAQLAKNTLYDVKYLHAERDDPVVSHEEGQELVGVDQHAEVFDQRLPEEEVVGRDQEEPRQGPEPWQIVHPVNRVSDVDDLCVTLDLNLNWYLVNSI